MNEFHDGLKSVINYSITRDVAIRVIAQHVVLARVFDALFSGKFTSRNPISKVLSKIASSFGLDAELEELEGFYTNVEEEIGEIKTSEARQNFIKTIYGNFFKSTSKKETEKYGVVFTPVDVVDFVIHSVQDVLNRCFGVGFDDARVKVLEPFAGTGTFVTRLLGSGLLGSNAYQKYRHDLLANEMILLAYYIATVNIETTYSSLNEGRYVPFEGMSYTDTLRQDPRYLQGGRHKQEQTPITGMFEEADKRVRRQKSTNVNVIIGNPPYSAGQSNANDENPNTKYPALDQRIKDTYVLNVKASNVNSIYDSYIRSLRWASDRIGASGVIAFVTNGSFMSTPTTAGLRASLVKEFDEVWCLDLRGNQRTQGETSQKEGGKIFGTGSRTPVAVIVLVKSPKSGSKKPATVRYKDIGDCLTKEEKLEILKNCRSIKGVTNWKIIVPDKHNDWLEQRDDMFDIYQPLINKNQTTNGSKSVFRMYSTGILTSRDTWAYNSNLDTVAKNMKMHIDYCNSQSVDKPKINPKKAKWSSGLKRLKRLKPDFKKDKIRVALYRPFFKQHLYFDSIYNQRLSQIPHIFPNNNSDNSVICVPHNFTGEFSIIMTNLTPDFSTVSVAQCFPLYVYDNGVRKYNITDFTLTTYKNFYHKNNINKIDIFYYVYGILHHKKYRKKFASNLSKGLPNIPMAPDFTKFRNVGENLAQLHINFESCKKFKLGNPLEKFGNPHRLSFGKKGRKADKTKIKINGVLAFENIPQPKYHVNGRTPLEWVVDRYNKTIDKDSAIVNNPLEGMNEDDIIAVIERAVYVGLESDRLIAELPDEFEPKNWKPKKSGLDAHIDT